MCPPGQAATCRHVAGFPIPGYITRSTLGVKLCYNELKHTSIRVFIHDWCVGLDHLQEQYSQFLIPKLILYLGETLKVCHRIFTPYIADCFLLFGAPLTRVGVRSRFGGEAFKIKSLCPRNGTSLLKRLHWAPLSRRALQTHAEVERATIFFWVSIYLRSYLGIVSDLKKKSKGMKPDEGSRMAMQKQML